MTWNLRKALSLALAAVVLIFAAWMLWPRSLEDDLDLEGRPLSATIITSGVEVTDMNSTPYHDFDDYAVEPGSPEADAIREILGRYSWHPCLDTLTGADAISDIGNVSVYLYIGDMGASLSVHNGTGKARLNDRVVRIGYLGNSQAAALCEELARLLRTTVSLVPTA